LVLGIQLASRDGMSRMDLEVVAEDDINNYQVGKCLWEKRLQWSKRLAWRDGMPVTANVEQNSRWPSLL